jgi:hypothetical protein
MFEPKSQSLQPAPALTSPPFVSKWLCGHSFRHEHDETLDPTLTSLSASGAAGAPAPNQPERGPQLRVAQNRHSPFFL